MVQILSRRKSAGPALIRAEEPAEAIAAFRRVARHGCRWPIDRPIPESLMRPFLVVVFDVLVDGVSE